MRTLIVGKVWLEDMIEVVCRLPYHELVKPYHYNILMDMVYAYCEYDDLDFTLLPFII